MFHRSKVPDDGLSSLNNNLLKLIRLSRHFFARESADEVMQQFVGHISPHDKRSVKAMCYICLFLPTQHVDAITWLTRYRHLWNCITNDYVWNIQWTCVLARLASYPCQPSQDEQAETLWREIVETSVEVLVASLNVPVGALHHANVHSASSGAGFDVFVHDVGDRVACIATMCGKILVRTISASRFSVEILADLMRQINNYFHPSNSGEWSGRLIHFVHVIITHLAKRIADETSLKGSSTMQVDSKPSRSSGRVYRVPKRITHWNLTDEQIDAIIDAVLEPCWFANFSKHMHLSLLARDAVTVISAIRPLRVIPRLLAQSIDNLQSLQHVQLTQFSLELLAATMPQVLDYIVENHEFETFIEILRLTLPGIDPNDELKTFSTIKLYLSLAYHIPIRPVNDILDASLWREWIFAVINGIWKFLAHFDNETPQGQEKNSMMILAQNKMLSQLVRDFTVALFAGMDDQLYTAAVSKLSDLISSDVHAESVAEYSKFVGYAASVNPSTALPILLPSLLKVSDSTPDTLVKWRLNFAAEMVCSAGEALLPFVQTITSLVKHGWDGAKSKDVKSATRLLLKNTLIALTHFHVDVRNCYANVLDKDPLKNWNLRVTLDDAKLKWREPTVNTIQAAQTVIKELLEDVHTHLNKASEGKPTTHANRTLSLDCLKLMRVVIRGSGQALPLLDAPKQVQLQSTWTSKHRTGLPDLYGFPVTSSYPMLSVEVREKVVELTCNLLTWVSTEGSVEVVTAASGLLGQVIECTGDHPTAQFQRFMSSQFKQKFGYTRHNSVLLPLVIQRAQALLWLRMAQRAYDPRRLDIAVGPSTTARVTDVLFQLSFYPYSSVRAQSQAALSEALKRCGIGSSRYLTVTLQRLSNAPFVTQSDETHKATVNGAAHLLSTKYFFKRITTQLFWKCRFFESIMSTEAHDHPVVQTVLLALVARVIHHASNSDAIPPVLAFPVQPEPQFVANAREAQQSAFAIKQHNLESMIQFVIRSLSGNLHWRYRCIGIATLHVLISRNSIAPTVETSLQVIRVLCDGLLHNNSQVREISAACLYQALAVSQVKQPAQHNWKRSDSVEWILEAPKQTFESAKRLPSIPTDQLAQFINVQLVEQLLEHLRHDLDLLGGGDKTHSSFQVCLHGILSDIAGLHKPWHPHQIVPPSALALFPGTWFATLRKLFEIIGPKSYDILPTLRTFAEKITESGAQITAALTVAALARATVTWSDDSLLNSFSSVISLIVKSTVAAVPETFGYWLYSLHFVLHDLNIQPTVIRELLEPIADFQQFSALTSSSKSKALSVVRCLVQQFGQRLPHDVVNQIVALLSTILAHPMKQVREEVGSLLAMLTITSWAVPTTLGGVKQSLSTPPIHTSLIELFENLIRLTTAPEVPDSKERLHAREVLLHWIQPLVSHSLHRPLNFLLPSLVPAIFQMQDDSDTFLPSNARNCLALLTILDANSLTGDLIQTLISHASWRIRASLFTIIQLHAFYHFESSRKLITDIELPVVMKSLSDNHLEVRQLAAITLAGLCQIHRAFNFQEIGSEFQKTASKKIGVDRNSEEFNSRLVVRHGAVLGLEALIQSSPYDVPEWLPNLLIALSKHIGDPNPIRETVKKTLGDFWRTHQDQWQTVHKFKFNDDQLSIVHEIVSPPSYYA
eukprot:c9764_g1_i1.p1 GENE.c9764_g1_i1~~c9764_g1_i1.p1  ORF type:complete len:1650 (+),score=463.85 c9764_g1_i1:462-5411(+)